jgi:hypothetical protein
VLDVALERLWDLPAEGWYGGDTHVHLTHRPTNYRLSLEDGLFFAEAEDLHLLTAFDPALFDPAAPERRRGRHIVRACQEAGSQFYGHIGLHHLRTLVSASGGGSAPAWPLNGSLIDAAHAQGGFATYAHPITTRRFGDVGGWPAGGLGRGLPVDAALGRVDGLDVLAYSNIDQQASLSLWYRLLNAGPRLAPSAGTDCGLCRAYDLPVAGYRTYAYLDGAGSADPSQFDVGAWWLAVRRGRSFVSNGPLLTATVDGRPPGSQVAPDAAGTVSLDVHHRSALGLSGRVEIVRDGSVCASWDVAPGEAEAQRSLAVKVQGAAWVAARFVGPPHPLCSGGRAFAHTGPFYVAAPGASPASAADARFFAEWIDRLAAEADRRGWPGAAERAAGRDEFARARAVFDPPRAVGGRTPSGVSAPTLAPPTAAPPVAPGLTAALRLLHGGSWESPPFTFEDWDSASPARRAPHDPVFDLPLSRWGPMAVVDVHVTSRTGSPLAPVLAVLVDGEVIAREPTSEGRWRGHVPLQSSLSVELPGYEPASRRLLDLPAAMAVRDEVPRPGAPAVPELEKAARPALVRRLGQLSVHFLLDAIAALRPA